MFEVMFAGGESRKDSELGCDYMVCRVVDQYGRDVELYSEMLVPDSWYDLDGEGKETPDDERESFDRSAFEELKGSIIQQARDAGIDPADLRFYEG